MKSLLHPNFKLNGEAFSSSEELKIHAKHLIENGKEEEIAIGKFISEWLNANDFITVKTSGSPELPKKLNFRKSTFSIVQMLPLLISI